MDLWQAAAELILTLLERHAVLTVFVLVLLEESGLPLPVPSDVAVLLAGSQIGQGRVNPIPAYLAAELAAVVGGSILYTIARRGAGRCSAASAVWCASSPSTSTAPRRRSSATACAR